MKFHAKIGQKFNQNKKSKKQKSLLNFSPHCNFLYVFFRFSYYFLCSPFRFTKVGKGKFGIHNWLPQKILCGIATILASYRSLIILRKRVERMELGKDGPLSYFSFFTICAGVVYTFAFYKGFWLNEQAYLKLIQFVDSSQHLLPSKANWVHSACLATLICSTFSIFTFYTGVIDFFKTSNWSVQWWLRRLVAESRYSYFMGNDTQPLEETSETFSLTFFDSFLAVIEIFTSFFRTFTGYYGDLCILVNVLTLYIPVLSFRNQIYSQIVESDTIVKKIGKKYKNSRLLRRDLQNYIKRDVNEKIKLFKEMAILSELIGNSVGELVFPFLVEAVSFYSSSFHEVLVAGTFGLKLRRTFYFTEASIIICLSADITRKMRWFRYWLGKQGRVKLLDENVLSSILNDLNANKVGINAAGMFTVDYKLVGKLASLSLMLFIVRLQSVEVPL